LVKPFRLRLERTGDTKGADFDFDDFGQNTTDIEESTRQERPQLVEDYRSFFSKVGSETRIQVSVQSSIADYFSHKRTDLIEKYTIVLGDSDLKDVYARVIFEPKKRKRVDAMAIREEIVAHVKADLGSKLDERNLILHAVNRKADLMVQTGAGRIEQSDDDDSEAVIARQDGIAGRVLQSAMVSGVLSTLEYTANENRRFIDRWGFFGLLVFVWIPFLASGVLVGAMLGLVARMRSKIVITATAIGGTAASITWAYTAETIIHFMHKFQIDFVIPIIIAVFLAIAFLHIRTTKKRREAELFADTWIAVKDQVSESMEGS
ncbi:MAG TPA: small multi-drug export protein, partial [Candidatus Poseidoniales archaeon]|nr:small multi-drug export protein [Candidatus Poseidoniales archaeon]